MEIKRIDLGFLTTSTIQGLHYHHLHHCLLVQQPQTMLLFFQIGNWTASRILIYKSQYSSRCKYTAEMNAVAVAMRSKAFDFHVGAELRGGKRGSIWFNEFQSFHSWPRGWTLLFCWSKRTQLSRPFLKCSERDRW